MWKILTMITACLAPLAVGYRILVVFPFPMRSHGILGNGMVRHLLEDGHEISYVTPYPVKDPPAKLTQVDVSANLESHLFKLMRNMILKQDMTEINEALFDYYNETLMNKNVQKLLNDQTQHFDVVIVEWMFGEFFSGFSAVFECPFIWSLSMEPHGMILELIDETLNPAYSRDLVSGNTNPMSFVQRAQNLGFYVMNTIFKTFVFLGKEKDIYQRAFGPAVAARGRSLPPYDDIRFNASLVLGNSHASLGEATRLPQNYKPIGGYHIETGLKPLPENLKNIMDSAKYGVIYFSMGSNLRSNDLPGEAKRSLLRMFGELKQTVLWKFEEDLPGVPANVHVLKWAPQPSILAHPNCVLFITHGGLLSTTESIHYGVPIIGIPVYADQYPNIDLMAKKGIAARVDLDMTAPGQLHADLKVAIVEMVNNPKYKTAVKELSFVYHDRPVPPGKELTHWVRHVARTRGAFHLRSPALQVSWYQKTYLDLAAVILVLVLGLRFVLRRLFCRRKTHVKDKRY